MPTVFISSTFVDLADIRKILIRWLSEVFGVELVVMETFGSDADPPDITSLRRVRDCDIFIGIYARRYGTVSTVTEKSITEMELDEAERAHSGGIVRDLLLYVLDSQASWPATLEETDDSARRKLARLRERIQVHTPSYFRDENDLLLGVTRDLHRKLNEHFRSSPLQIRDLVLPAAANLTQPVGMEFLRSVQRDYLIGRASTVDELRARIDENQLLLLLGDSGTGKTSLINAGIMPEAVRLDWRPIYVRPLGLPLSDVTHQLQASLFRGGTAYRGPLLPFLLQILDLLPEKRLLLIIDQFEDILIARSQEEVDKLIVDLRLVYQSSNNRLRVVLSYRADLEGRLGHFWQIITGSASGLPRVYLTGLSVNEVENGIIKAAESLHVPIAISAPEWEVIKTDFVTASAAVGQTDVYPPHIQMLIEHIWKSTEKGKIPYTFEIYRKARGIDGIVGDFLGRQLEYADDKQGQVRLVLIALVRSYGVKAQKRLDELTSETGLDEASVELAVEKLIDLRLVRHIEQYYEIAHDFIARRVISELVNSEEREFKRFQELLSSKGAAFSTTGALLTNQEMLALYKHRQRIVPDEAALHLLLVSWLAGEGPALFWLLNPECKKRILNWLASEFAKVEFGEEQKAAGILLKLTLEGRSMTETDFDGLKRYKSALELASLMKRSANDLAESVLLRGLRHRRVEVRRASCDIVKDRLRAGQWALLQAIKDSSNPRMQDAYYECATSRDVPIAITGGTRAVEEFRNLQSIQRASNEEEASAAYVRLKKMRPGRDTSVLGENLLHLQTGRLDAIAKALEPPSTDDAEAICRCFADPPSAVVFQDLLGLYARLNAAGPATEVSADAIARAIARTARPELVTLLRECVRQITLASSARWLILGLLSHGQLEDVDIVLRRIAESDSKIEFENHTALGQAVARRMMAVGSGVPEFLQDVMKKREFWQYRDKDSFASDELLGLRAVENRALYIRIAAYSAIGAATNTDLEVLFGLMVHPYGLIARAAVIRLVRILGASAFKQMIERVREGLSQTKAASFAESLRDAEIEHYNVANMW